MIRYVLPVFLCLLNIAGCQPGEEQGYTPKPRMYPYANLPTPQYETVTEKADCGFTFRKSVYAQISDRKSFFGESLKTDCWFNLMYPDMNANVHFTYYPIGQDHTYDALVNESFRLVYEHSAIASAIDESPLNHDNQENGMIFSLKGPVASPLQFFLTDSTNHFLRAALYFNSRPNPDSIAPVLDYLRTDMDTLIQSLHWQ